MLTWRTFYLFLFLYRSVFSVLGEVVVMRLTTIGDAYRYQTADLDQALILFHNIPFTWQIKILGTAMTDIVGAIFAIAFAGNPILFHLGFQTIAFVGILVFLMAVEPRERKWMALFVLFPSFSLWTSITTKECLVVLMVGLVGSYIVKIYYNKERLRFYHIVAFLLLIPLKAYYLPVLLFLIVLGKAARRTRPRAAVALIAGLLTLIPLYLLWDRVEWMVFEVAQPAFRVSARSTREAFWEDSYDVFLLAPYGMFLSFIGPTVTEASKGILHLASLLESIVMLTVLAMLVVRRLPDLPVFSSVVGVFGAFWILFPTYPLGVMNPGSAIRYRSGYLLIFLMIVVVIMSREAYSTWLHKPPERRRASAPVPSE